MRILQTSRSSFHLCGVLGLAGAIGLTSALAVLLDRSVAVMVLLATVGVAIFLALAMVTKVLSGAESLTYYHHVVSVLGGSALVLYGARVPLLSYLDLVALGLAAFTVVGRIGCFMVGCCYGRPSRRGIRYRPEHVEAGFPMYLVGVPLAPIQLVESAWLVSIVAVGTAFALHPTEPGTVLVFYLLAYGLGRFLFEFLRGDAGRPYFLGFSEAQWTSAGLSWIGAAIGLSGSLPAARLAVASALAITLAMVMLAMRRRLVPSATDRLWAARHVREVAEATAELAHRSSAPLTPADSHVIHLAETSEGVRVSTTPPRGRIRHYALSRVGREMHPKEAATLGRLLSVLRHNDVPFEITRGRAGVFHVFIGRQDTDPATGRGASGDPLGSIRAVPNGVVAPE